MPPEMLPEVPPNPVVAEAAIDDTVEPQSTAVEQQHKSEETFVEKPVADPPNQEQLLSTTKTDMEPKHDAPSQRMKQYLQKAKEARVMKETEAQEKTEKTQPASEPQGETPVETKVETKSLEPAVGLLLDKPKHWVEDVTAVTAGQQQPPKPRGRKKKSAEDASKAKTPEATTAKAKTKASKKTEPAEKPAEKSETPLGEENVSTKASTRKKPAPASVADTEQPAAKAKAKRQRKAVAPPETYQPLEVTQPIGADKALAFDAYAVACANADVHALETMEVDAADKQQQPVTKPDSKPKQTKKTKQDPEETGQKEQKTRKRQQTEVAQQEQQDDSEKTKRPKRVRTAEEKARLSRKSCAYKKAYNEAIKKGVEETQARKAGSKVTQLKYACFQLFLYLS